MEFSLIRNIRNSLIFCECVLGFLLFVFFLRIHRYYKKGAISELNLPHHYPTTSLHPSGSISFPNVPELRVFPAPCSRVLHGHPAFWKTREFSPKTDVKALVRQLFPREFTSQGLQCNFLPQAPFPSPAPCSSGCCPQTPGHPHHSSSSALPRLSLG